jgi:hypothetical protein
MTTHDIPIPTLEQSDSASIRSIEKLDGTFPRALATNAEVITAKGNVISKDHTLVSTVDSDASLSTNVFADPEVRDYYIKLYEDCKYECRHAFDADATWTEEEERRVVRRLDWHGRLLCIGGCYNANGLQCAFGLVSCSSVYRSIAAICSKRSLAPYCTT